MKKIIKRHICILPRRKERKEGRRRNKSTRATPYIRQWHTPIHREDLYEEPLTPYGWWCLSTEEARTRLLKGEGFSHLLTWMLHAPAIFFIYIFFNLSKDHTSPYPTWYQRKNQHEKIKKPLDASYLFFCLQGCFSNCTMLLKRKNKKNTPIES